MMKKATIIIAALLIAAGGTAGWIYHNGGWSLKGKADNSTVYVTDIRTITGKTPATSNRYAGMVEPQETVPVQIEDSKKVGTVFVKVGDEVQKGQVLFEYDLSKIIESLEEARLEMENLQNQAAGLSNELDTYRAEIQKPDNANNQLHYTIEIQNKELELKKNEYEQKKKQMEIERLEQSTENTQVTSQIDGIIQKIDTGRIEGTEDSSVISNTLDQESSSYSDRNTDSAFMTILSTGSYRVKGTINELNRDDITPGEPVIIRSRADKTRTWNGIILNIDNKNSKASGNSDSYNSGGDMMTSSSTYPFYIELGDSDGLILGQHVYIEKDLGQGEAKDGIWLPEYFINENDDGSSFVWCSENDRLAIRRVVLGEYDESLQEYEIREGLKESESLAYPVDGLEEGMKTRQGSLDQTMKWDEEESYSDETTDNYSDESSEYETEGDSMAEDGFYKDDAGDGDEWTDDDNREE